MERDRQRERNFLPSAGSFLKCIQHSEPNLGFPRGWQRPKNMKQHLMPPRMCTSTNADQKTAKTQANHSHMGYGFPEVL